MTKDGVVFVKNWLCQKSLSKINESRQRVERLMNSKNNTLHIGILQHFGASNLQL